MGAERSTSGEIMDKLIDRVDALHSSPPIVCRILQLLADPEFDILELAKQLETDPALAAAVLKLANSSSLGMSRKISSLREAITYIGARPLRLVVLSFGLVDRLTKGAPAKVCHDFWRRALTMASVAAHLCPDRDSARRNEAYTAGLLADVGVLLLAQVETERYAALYEQHGHGPNLVATEQEEFGFDHAELGGRLLWRWNLPERLTKAVARHHDDGDGEDQLRRLILAGDMLADALWVPQTPRMGELQRFVQSEFNLDLDGLISLVAECKSDVLACAEVFRVELHESIDCEALRENARRQFKEEAMQNALDLESMTAALKHDPQ